VGALTSAQQAEIVRRVASIRVLYSENEQCPACRKTGEIGGDVEYAESRLEPDWDEAQGALVPGETHYEVITDSFVCRHCGLILTGPDQIEAAEMSPTFEYLVLDPEYDNEPDYGND
jgi:rubredoxin